MPYYPFPVYPSAKDFAIRLIFFAALTLVLWLYGKYRERH